jgi:hypothetical protein
MPPDRFSRIPLPVPVKSCGAPDKISNVVAQIGSRYVYSIIDAIGAWVSVEEEDDEVF